MDDRKCRAMIESVREEMDDCPAVRMCDSWHRLCGFPNKISADEDPPCEACKDHTTMLYECHCERRDFYPKQPRNCCKECAKRPGKHTGRGRC